MSAGGRAFLTVDGPDGWAVWITDDGPGSADPETDPPVNLDIGRHIQYLLLQRVHSGGVTAFSTLYSEDGRLVHHLANIGFEGLAEAGCFTLSEPAPDRSRRVSLTEVGLARYRELYERAAGG